MIKTLLNFLFSDAKHSAAQAQPSIEMTQRSRPESQGCSSLSIASAFSDWRSKQFVSEEVWQSLATSEVINELNNRNGYIREFCLHVLDARNEIQALPNVLKRFNDYVPQVHKKAQQIGRRWLINCDIRYLVQNLGLILALENQSRVQAFAFQSLALARLAEPGNQPALMEGLVNKDHRISGASWKFATQIFNWNHADRVWHAMKTKNPQVMRLVVKDFEHLDAKEILHYFEVLGGIRDPFAKRAILNLAINRGLVDLASITTIALWDKNSGIRWLARKYVIDLGKQTYLRKIYLTELAEQKCVKRALYALEGLVDIRSEDIKTILRSLLNTPHIRIWERALSLLCQQDREFGYTTLKVALSTGDQERRALCFKIAGQNQLFLPLSSVKQYAKHHSNDRDAAENILIYANSIGGWTGLEIATTYQEFSIDVQHETSAMKRTYLQTWAYSQNFTSPTLDQLTTIKGFLDATQLEQLGPLGQQLQFCITEEMKRIKS